MSEHKQPLWSRPVAAALALSLGISLAGCRANDPAALMAQARQYRDQGDVKAAVIQLKNLIQLEANNGAARIMLAELYLDQGYPQSAEKELQRALALGAERARVTLLLGRALIMQGQYERVLAEIAPAASAAPPALRAATLSLRANALLGMTKIAPARALFNEALQLDPAAPEPLLGLARIAIWERQGQQARTLLARALEVSPADLDCLRYHADLLRADGKPEAALAEQQKILHKHPNNAQALVDIANLHTDAGRFEQARASLTAARNVAGNSLGLAYSEAMLAFRENKLALALEADQRVLRAAPDHYPGILLAGAINSAMGNHQAAELHLRKFLAANPGHPYASKLIAGAHLGAGRPEAALEVLRPLLDGANDDVELLALAGEASLRVRKFGDASAYFEKASALRPQAAALHTGLALSRMGGGDGARAVAELERAASLDRSPARSGVLLVMSYLRANEPDKALKAVLEMEKNGDNPLLRNLKGGIFLARKDLAGARASFDAALALDAAYLPALANLAQLDKMEHQDGAAKKRYLAALAKAPADPALLEALAGLALEAGDKVQALSYIERALAASPEAAGLGMRAAGLYLGAGERQKALVLAQRLAAGSSAGADALALLGQAYAANQDYAQAAEAYTRLALLTPKAALPLLHLASVHIARNDQSAALTALRRALVLEPGMPEARITLVNVLLRQGKSAEAMALATQAQKAQPGAPIGFKLEGDIASIEGKHDTALKAYERALALAPAGAPLVQVFGALQKLGRQGEADARMLAWFKDHPGDLPTRLYYASSKLARNDPAAAAPQYEAVLKADPDNLAALNDLAWCYQRSGERRALDYAERAYRVAPDNPAVMDTLGWILLEQGQVVRALPLLQKASALAPNAGEIQFHYGMVLAKSGDKRGARQALEKALATPQTFARRAQAKALLATL